MSIPPEQTPAPQSPQPIAPEGYKAPWELKAEHNKEAKDRIAELRGERAQRQKSRRFRSAKSWIIWGALIWGVWWFYHPHGIFVFADPLSAYRYRGVLKDLKQHMPEEYELVKNHIDTITISYIITGGNYAGYAQEGERGDKKVKLLENTFIQGPGYAHSILVHEACHGLQFEKDLPFAPFCENQAREHACNQWGIRVLKAFNGKPEMIKHYERIAVGDTVYGNSCLRQGKVKSMPEL